MKTADLTPTELRAEIRKRGNVYVDALLFPEEAIFVQAVKFDLLRALEHVSDTSRFRIQWLYGNLYIHAQ